MRVQDAAAAMRAFPGKDQLAAFPIECRTPLDQLFYCVRTFADQRQNRFGFAQAIACGDRICFMQADFVVVGKRRRDAALGVLGIRFFQAVLGHHEHAPRGCQFYRGPQSSNACADNKIIGLYELRLRQVKWYNDRVCLPSP